MTRPDDHDWTDAQGFDWLPRAAEAQRRQARAALEAPIDYATPERREHIRQESRWWRRWRARVVAWLTNVPDWR